MNILENNIAKLNDIVFENRNKSYGAYAIRSSYDNTILKSLGITFLIFISLSLAAVWLSNTAPEEIKLDAGTNVIPPEILYTTEIDVTPPQKTEAAVVNPPAATAVNSQAVSTNLNNNAVEQNTNQIQTTDGTHIDNGQTANPDVIPGDGADNPNNGTGENPENSASKEPLDLAKVEVMPSFDNMASFLHKNLKYPTMAISENISGRVVVNFIIDETGNVEKATILKGIGYGCDEEALRVIKLMPKWNPGMVKGKPVKVSFSLPIVFRLQ